MRRTLGAVLFLFTALAPLNGQSRFRAGFGAGAGIAQPITDTRNSYTAGPWGKGELSFGLAGGPWSLRLETWYVRLHGAGPPELDFPALEILTFSASGVRRVGAADRAVTPYLFAGVGAANLEDALPFASWRTRLGLQLGGGVEVGRRRLRAYVEGRVVHVASDPPTDFGAFGAGARWGL